MIGIDIQGRYCEDKNENALKVARRARLAERKYNNAGTKRMKELVNDPDFEECKQMLDGYDLSDEAMIDSKYGKLIQDVWNKY